MEAEERKCQCGGPLKFKSQINCRRCEILRRLRAAERVKIEDYDLEDINLENWPDTNEGFIDLDEVSNSAQSNGWLEPAWGWACVKEPYPGIDIQAAIENSTEDMFEQASDHLIDVEGLRAFVKAWNDKQTVYAIDYTRKKVVVFDPERFAKILAGEKDPLEIDIDPAAEDPISPEEY
jgi:hypothetical protein